MVDSLAPSITAILVRGKQVWINSENSDSDNSDSDSVTYCITKSCPSICINEWLYANSDIFRFVLSSPCTSNDNDYPCS